MKPRSLGSTHKRAMTRAVQTRGRKGKKFAGKPRPESSAQFNLETLLADTPAAGKAPSQDLWVAPRTSLTPQRDDQQWSMHPAAASDARLLELADIALGLRKPQPFRKRKSLFLASQEKH